MHCQYFKCKYFVFTDIVGKRAIARLSNCLIQIATMPANLAQIRVEMDFLVMEDILFAKQEQPALRDDENWQESCEVD